MEFTKTDSLRALLNSCRLTSSFVPSETLLIQRYRTGCTNRISFVATLADSHFLRFGALRSDLAVDMNRDIHFNSRVVHVDSAALRYSPQTIPQMLELMYHSL
jgi:hypothetical protein